MLQTVPKVAHYLKEEEITKSGWQVQVLDCETTLSSIEEVVEEFKDLFRESVGLPPHRGVYDHRIPLNKGLHQ